jgi:L-fuculose-phosphate aldolase
MSHEFWLDIVNAGQYLDRKGLVAAVDGNISLRLDDGSFLCTPSGVPKGNLADEHCTIVAADGEKISGSHQPSSEMPMHLAIYRQRPDVRAIIHCHPVVATAFAAVHRPLNVALLPEVLIALGTVPVAEYAAPSTKELAESVEELILNHEAILLANHGAVTVGEDLSTALHRMEKLEQFATIYRAALQLGKPKLLSRQQVDAIVAIYAGKGIRQRSLQGGIELITKESADK